MDNRPSTASFETPKPPVAPEAPAMLPLTKLGTFSYLPLYSDTAFLLLRVWLGISLFAVHGYEKLSTFSLMATRFPDPLHLGQTPSLGAALLSDAVCSLLVMAGLFTRFCALYVAGSIGVAFLLVWHAELFDIKGEVAYLYVGGYLAIALAGPGKYSLDHWLHQRQKRR